MGDAKVAENDVELRIYLEGVVCALGSAIGSGGLSDCGLWTAFYGRRAIAQPLMTCWPDEEQADPDRKRRVARELLADPACRHLLARELIADLGEEIREEGEARAGDLSREKTC